MVTPNLKKDCKNVTPEVLKICVTQLNRISDFGSEGYRFESCRGHLL